MNPDSRFSLLLPSVRVQNESGLAREPVILYELRKINHLRGSWAAGRTGDGYLSEKETKKGWTPAAFMSRMMRNLLWASSEQATRTRLIQRINGWSTEWGMVEMLIFFVSFVYFVD